MIKDNVAKIRCQIRQACVKAGRDPSEITLVAVSKNRGPEAIREAVSCRITDIGENRVQEAATKYNNLQFPLGHQPKWHLVGHLQTNKVKEAVKIFDLIHSVDSLRLAEEIDKQALKLDKVQDLLLEIKTSPEETKYGIKPEEAIEIAGRIARLSNIRLCGLMTIAPLMDNSEGARPYFKTLKGLFDKINSLAAISHKLSIVSMGMTDDFAVAIEEGATMIRLGRAVFEG